jgi:hypothetical protein
MTARSRSRLRARTITWIQLGLTPEARMEMAPPVMVRLTW